MQVLGLDIGGTKMEAAILDASGNAIARKRVPTERDNGYQDVMLRMVALCDELLKSQNLDFANLDGIGIGLPGAVHPQNQVMLNGNTQIFIDMPIASDFARLSGFKGSIKCANDANCFALAEALMGAGVEHANQSDRKVNELTSIGIILGTGCGGGFIVNGKMLVGKHGACEIGHSTLVTDGRSCYCGRRGCAENYLSGTGLELDYFDKTGLKISGKEIFDRLETGDRAVKEVIKSYKMHLAEFLVNLNNLFDPDFFVLGGGVSLQKEIYNGLEDLFWDRTFIKNANPKVYQHQLGDSAGVIGAGLQVLP